MLCNDDNDDFVNVFSKEVEQEKKSKDDDDSHPNVQQLTQLNWVDNVHWTFVGDDDSGDAGNDIDGGGDLMVVETLVVEKSGNIINGIARDKK